MRALPSARPVRLLAPALVVADPYLGTGAEHALGQVVLGVQHGHAMRHEPDAGWWWFSLNPGTAHPIRSVTLVPLVSEAEEIRARDENEMIECRLGQGPSLLPPLMSESRRARFTWPRRTTTAMRSGHTTTPDGQSQFHLLPTLPC